MINKRLKEIRTLMANRGINAYLVTTSDPHQSEYLADFYKTREFISGFTGSAGTVVITKDEAILWTDGRYFIQAAYELSGTGFELYKMGVPGFPTVTEFLLEKVPVGGKIGFNGNTISFKLYRELLDALDQRMLISNLDFIADMWKDRPSIPKDKAFVHELKYTGTSARQRIDKLRDEMYKVDADYNLIAALDDIAYLFCIRGNDVAYNPVVFSYALVSKEKAFLYINEDKLTEEVKEHLETNDIIVKSYDEIYDHLKEIPGKSNLIFDPKTVNLAVINSINSNVRLVKTDSIIAKQKAVKNSTELEHMRNAFIKDGVAMVKFLNWVETGTPTGTVNEVLAAEKLNTYRSQQNDFVEPSFSTISAYGKNAAMPHYSPNEQNPVILEAKGLYLVDSGGQYFDGTTDITRTIALGELTEDEKYHYTLTLKSHISLSDAYFKTGTTGYYLDAFARLPMLKHKIDFAHGTGHGIGYFLNVHEGPQSISTRFLDVKMEEGMVVSVEPGVYINDSHGIRIENLVVVEKVEKNEFGDFLGFEILTICPIDTRPVITELLTDEELKWLNDYNKRTYDLLEEHLTGSDLAYLKKATEEVKR